MTDVTPITTYRLTEHAKLEMRRRQISEEDIAQVLADPEQSESIRAGRMAFQSRVKWGDSSKTYLLRVFVDVDRTPPDVVTAYRTSRILKYWRTDR